MSTATTQLSISNRALQLLGYPAISSLTQNDRGAKAINRCYTPVLQNMLRANCWGFSVRRASLAASSTPPAFGMANYFPLPSDYLDLAPPDNSPALSFGGVGGCADYRDFQIENSGGALCIASNMTAPLNIRYVTSNVTEANFDACFAEAFAAALALAAAEELTQNNTKIQNCETILSEQLAVAKQRGAFESQPVQPPVDPWLLVRR